MGVEVKKGYEVSILRDEDIVEALARGAGRLSARPAEVPLYLSLPAPPEKISPFLVEGLPRVVVVRRDKKWVVLFDCVRPANTLCWSATYFRAVELHLVEAGPVTKRPHVISIRASIPHKWRRTVGVSVEAVALREGVGLEELPPCMQAAIMLSH